MKVQLVNTVLLFSVTCQRVREKTCTHGTHASGLLGLLIGGQTQSEGPKVGVQLCMSSSAKPQLVLHPFLILGLEVWVSQGCRICVLNVLSITASRTVIPLWHSMVFNTRQFLWIIISLLGVSACGRPIISQQFQTTCRCNSSKK